MSGFFVVGQLPQAENKPIPQKWILMDLDWTLIRPLKGKLFKNGIGWTWLPGRLNPLLNFLEQGYTLGIITNQKPTPIQSLEWITQRMQEVHQVLENTLNVNVPILVGTTSSLYRKPNIGWLQHIQLLPGSIMIGDAAGRPGDFSDSDKMFAQNAGLFFLVPEQVFPTADPDRTIASILAIPPSSLERGLAIICMGAPGSGKTTFAKKLESRGWYRVSSDDFSSNINKMQKAVQTYLTSVPVSQIRLIIDATNPTFERRSLLRSWLLITNTPSYLIHFLNPGEDRNNSREKPVPKIAYNTYWKKYEEPNSETEAPLISIG